VYNSTRGYPVGLIHTPLRYTLRYFNNGFQVPWGRPKQVYNGFGRFSYVVVYEDPPYPPCTLPPVYYILSKAAGIK